MCINDWYDKKIKVPLSFAEKHLIVSSAEDDCIKMLDILEHMCEDGFFPKERLESQHRICFNKLRERRKQFLIAESSVVLTRGEWQVIGNDLFDSSMKEIPEIFAEKPYNIRKNNYKEVDALIVKINNYGRGC